MTKLDFEKNNKKEDVLEENKLVYKKEKYCTAPHCQEEGQDG